MLKTLLLSTACVALMTFGAAAHAEMHEEGHDKGHEMHKEHKEHKDMTAKAVEKDYAEKPGIVETAIEAGDFTTLVAALEAAGLVDALKEEGPFTVFAPTDEAFAALPEGTLEDLLKPENKDKLAGILKYHVVSGKVMAGDIAEGESMVPTLAGEELTVTKSEDGVTVGGATVETADIKTSNGVIHVIDSVVLPE